MTRRTALLLALSIPLGSWRGLKAQSKLPTGKGWLTIDLNQWSGVTVKHGKDEVHFTAADILAALKEIP